MPTKLYGLFFFLNQGRDSRVDTHHHINFHVRDGLWLPGRPNGKPHRMRRYKVNKI